MDELNLSPEEQQMLMRLGIAPEELQNNRQQMDLAEQLRYGPGSEGRAAGRVYVAANPLEHMRDAIQRYKAKGEMKDLGLKREDILEGITRARGMYADLLRGKGQMSPVGPAYDQEAPVPMPATQRPIPGIGGGISIPPPQGGMGPPPIAPRPKPAPAPAVPAPTPPPAPSIPGGSYKSYPHPLSTPSHYKGGGGGPGLLAWLLRNRNRPMVK